VLPRLGIAGRQIFFAEASTAPSDAVSPSVRGSARRLWALYISLTLLLTTLLIPTGLGFFDALLHAFTAMSAGGFSNKAQSVMEYANPMMEWVMVPFLFTAGASFPLMLRALTREPLAIFRDGELKLYLLCAVSGIAALTFLAPADFAFEHKLRAASFQVASLLSCAGFASENYEEWAPGAKAVILLVMAAGGCAGSTGGGAKQVRYLLVFKFLRQEITRVLHPRAVLPIRHGKEVVPQRVMWAVFMLVLLFLGTYVVVATLLMLFEHGRTDGYGDFPAAIGSSIACVNNAGPGRGPAGPMGTFAGFSAASKLLLSAAMLVGRLEIVTVLALCHPHVWRSLSWGGGRVAKL
jgi:trk system potassium uptake protein TrkH